MKVFNQFTEIQNPFQPFSFQHSEYIQSICFQCNFLSFHLHSQTDKPKEIRFVSLNKVIKVQLMQLCVKWFHYAAFRGRIHLVFQQTDCRSIVLPSWIPKKTLLFTSCLPSVHGIWPNGASRKWKCWFFEKIFDTLSVYALVFCTISFEN